jgi:arginine-tRNA-protein transferase
VTQHFATRQLRFFLTAPSPCPYLPGREERKVFAHLPMSEGASVNDSLTQVGFRRSQNIAYRPACEGCDACVSAHLVEAEATMEQFDLLRRYLTARHGGGGMADMTWADYVAMVEDTAVRTHLIEYRTCSNDRGPGDLIACVLVDMLADGLSLVYSFYEPSLTKRSLGSFAILDHVRQAEATGLPYVYLGYWIAGSIKMAYKARFNPLEVLKPGGWRLLSELERISGTM